MDSFAANDSNTNDDMLKMDWRQKVWKKNTEGRDFS